MGVASLRREIAERASELMTPALIAAGVTHHKKGWKECPCSWCQKKREATVVIGSHVPRMWRGQFVEDVREGWREEQRGKYRKALQDLEGF